MPICEPWTRSGFQPSSIHPSNAIGIPQPQNLGNYGPASLPSPPTSPCAYPTPEDFPLSRKQDARLHRILGASLQLDEILGTGAYGVVYKASDHSTYPPTQYAVKALNKFNADGSRLDHRQQDFQRREIQLHHAASAHPNVVSTLKIMDDDDCTFVILEYCPEGDLFSNITERARYVGNDSLIRSVFLQILDAVGHCHRLGIYHRDLKPENILVSNAGATVKLADFGLATTDERSRDFGCGSTFYMSPECLDQTCKKPWYECAPNDVWSLGVILVNLACGRNPWKKASFEDSTYRAYMNDRKFLKSILPLSDSLTRILERIFEVNPDERITLIELRREIMSCEKFTCSPTPSVTSIIIPQQRIAALLPSPPPSPIYCNSSSSLSHQGSMISDNSDHSTDSICSSNTDQFHDVEALPSATTTTTTMDDFEAASKPQQVQCSFQTPSYQSAVASAYNYQYLQELQRYTAEQYALVAEQYAAHDAASYLAYNSSPWTASNEAMPIHGY